MKSTIKLITLIFIIISVTTSCTSLILSLKTSKKAHPKKLQNFETGKEIVYIGMSHIAKPEFYESVKQIVDSLRKEDYTIFYEGVGLDTSKYSKATLDTILRKRRRLLGFHLTQYNDSTNKSLPKALKNKKYIAQTAKNTGVHIEKDIKADLPMDSLINLWEKENKKKVPLTTYDFETPLNAPYKPEYKLSSWNIVYGYRNSHLEKTILESKYKKIAVVYGKAHYKWIKVYLTNLKGYEKVK